MKTLSLKEFARFKSFDLGDVEEIFVNEYFEFNSVEVEDNPAQINFVYAEKIEEENFYEF